MKVLVTGATGLVGGELTKLCLEKNISVNFLTTRKNKIVRDKLLQGYYWNPDQSEIDIECFEGVDAIINLAGATVSKRWTKAHKKRILSSRINSIKTLLNGVRSLKDHQITSFVTASAIGLYPSSLEHFYSEDEESRGEGFLPEVVRAWENEADSFANEVPRVAKIRIGLVLSSKGGALAEMIKPIKSYVGAIFGSGEQWQSWIHLHDLSRIFLFAIENELQGSYNAVAPNPVTNAKLTREIARILKRPLLLPNIPKFAMKLVLGEMSSLLFSSQRVSSKKIEQEGFEFYYANISRALEAILLEQNHEKTGDGALQKEFV